MNEAPILEVSEFSRDSTEFVFDLVKLDGRTDIPRPFLHRHAYYHLLCLKQATGTHNLDFEYYDIRDNTIFFISPGQIHEWYSTTLTTGYVVNFSVEFFLRMFPRPGEIEEFPFFQAMSEVPVLYLSNQHMNEVLTLMALMESEAQENKLWHYDIIRSYLLIMFTKLRRLHQSRPQEGTVIKQHSLVKRFKSLVNQHYLDDKSVQSFASALNVTDKRLNEALRHATGKTATQLIHERIILEAKRQLMQSDLSIAQIAYNLKFEDPGYFSRFFKKNVNLTPVQFKNKFLGLQRPNASVHQKIP